jgi:hypothetical protein
VSGVGGQQGGPRHEKQSNSERELLANASVREAYVYTWIMPFKLLPVTLLLLFITIVVRINHFKFIYCFFLFCIMQMLK